MSKKRWTESVDDPNPFVDDHPDYFHMRTDYRRSIDRMPNSLVYDAWTTIFQAEPTKMYHGDIFYHMREELKNLPFDDYPIFRWEGDKKITTTWRPMENLILLGEKLPYQDFFYKAFPDPIAKAQGAAVDVLRFARPEMPLQEHTGKTWGITRDMLWELSSKLHDVAFKEGIEKLQQLSPEKLNELMLVVDLDPTYNKKQKDQIHSLLKQVKQKPNAEYIHYIIADEIHHIAEDKFFSPNPITADAYAHGEYTSRELSEEVAEQTRRGRLAARNPELVKALKKEMLKIIEAGFTPAESAHVMHYMVLTRLLGDQTVTAKKAIRINNEAMRYLPPIGDKGKKAIQKAMKLGMKLPKKLPIFLLGSLFYGDIFDEEGEAAAMMSSAAILPIAGDKPENWLKDLPTDKPTTVWRSEAGRKPYPKTINPKKVKVIEGDQIEEFNKLRKQGKLRTSIGSISEGSYPQIDVLVAEHYRRMGYDHILVKRRGPDFPQAFDPAEIWDIRDPRHIKWYTPTPTGAEFYAIRSTLGPAGQDRPGAMAARREAFGPYPPFRSSPTRPEIVSATDPAMGEEYAERQMQHLAKLEGEPYVDVTEGKPLTRYGTTQRPSLAKPIIKQYGSLDRPSPRTKGSTAGMTVDTGKLPRKKEFVQGIADVLYGGDIKKVEKQDIKHFSKRWKDYAGYSTEHIRESISPFSLEELTDPVERQLVEELRVIVAIRDHQTEGEASRAKAAIAHTKTAKQQAFEHYVNTFKTEKTRAEATLRRLQDDLKFTETALKRSQLEQAIVVTKRRIADLDQNIAAAADVFKKQGGFIEAPGGFFEGLSERAYREGQDFFVPETAEDLSKRFAKPTLRSTAKAAAYTIPIFAFDILDMYGLLTEPSESRMMEDIGSMIVGKEPGERRRLPITKEEIAAFEATAGQFQTMPAEDETLLETFFPGSLAEGQVITEGGYKVQVDPELAKKYMDYVMSTSRLDRNTGKWVQVRPGEFQDEIERRTFEEAAKGYSEWKEGPQEASRGDIRRAEELALETALKQETMPRRRPTITDLPPSPWSDILMGTDQPEKEEKRQEPKPVRIPKPAKIRKGDRPSKSTVPPKKRPSPYKKNIPLKPVDQARSEAAQLMMGEPTFEFIPTQPAGSTRLRALTPDMPIIGDVK